MDCWAGGSTELRNQMCQNIRAAILQDIQPRLVILATHESHEVFDADLRHNRWFSTFWQHFPKFEDAFTLIEGTTTTHPSILHSVFACQQVATTRWWQFQYLMDRLPGTVDRFWFFGLHWNICLRERELGWHNIRNHYRYNKQQKIDIMFRDDCMLAIPYDNFSVINSHQSYIDTNRDPAEHESWADIANDVFTRCESVGDHAWRLI